MGVFNRGLLPQEFLENQIGIKIYLYGQIGIFLLPWLKDIQKISQRRGTHNAKSRHARKTA